MTDQALVIADRTLVLAALDDEPHRAATFAERAGIPVGRVDVALRLLADDGLAVRNEHGSWSKP